MIALRRADTPGDADKYILTLPDGTEALFIVSNAEKKVGGVAGEMQAIAREMRAIAREVARNTR